MQRLNFTWGLPFTLLLAFCLFLGSVALAASPSITVTGNTPDSIPVGEHIDIPLSAMPDNQPTTTQECTITGPSWKWEATYTGTSSGKLVVSGKESATVDAYFTTPGTYDVVVSVKAKYSSTCSGGDQESPGSKSFSVNVVGVKSTLQWRNPSDYASTYQPVTDTLQVLKGTRLIFKAALNSSEGGWPSGKPTWTGADSGSGETVSFNAPTVSSSTADLKIVTAKCGTSTASASVLVYDFKPLTQAVDQFPGRDEFQYGVGEVVNLTYTTQPEGISVDLMWNAASGLSRVTGNQWIAGDAELPDVSAIIAEINSGPSRGEYRRIVRVAIPPSEVFMFNRYSPPRKGHVENTISLGAKVSISILPSNVSFKNIGVAELEAEAEGTEAYQSWTRDPNRKHPRTVDENGRPAYLPIAAPRNATEGSLAEGADNLAFGSEFEKVVPGVNPKGTFTYNIPWVYYVLNSPFKRDRPIGKGIYPQRIEVTKDGDVFLSKAGFSEFVKYSDATTYRELTGPFILGTPDPQAPGPQPPTP